MKTNKPVTNLVMTALMMALIIVTTMFVKVPIPFTQGYVHLGDAMIFLSVLVLGWKYGAVAAGIGSALGDIIGGFAFWAPWTLVIKGVMAVIMGLFITVALKHNKRTIGSVPVAELLGMIIAGAFMTVGYYAAEGIMYGNWAAPLMGIPWNIGQFVVGLIIAGALAAALYKTPARRSFAYQLDKTA